MSRVMVCGPTGWGESLVGGNDSAQGFGILVYAQTRQCLSPLLQVGLQVLSCSDSSGGTRGRAGDARRAPAPCPSLR